MAESGDYKRVREIFHAAYALEGEDRRAVLETLCTSAELRERVERLLDAQGETRGVEIPQVASEGGLPEIPGYTLRGLLGSGGMGAVYEAVQAQPKRRVAIKLITAGVLSEGLLQRFEPDRCGASAERVSRDGGGAGGAESRGGVDRCDRSVDRADRSGGCE